LATFLITITFVLLASVLAYPVVTLLHAFPVSLAISLLLANAIPVLLTANLAPKTQHVTSAKEGTISPPP
jgi:hypothetical protein